MNVTDSSLSTFIVRAKQVLAACGEKLQNSSQGKILENVIYLFIFV